MPDEIFILKNEDYSEVVVNEDDVDKVIVISDGVQGPTGPGVPNGGSVGQFLKKTGVDNYVTSWEFIVESDITNLDKYSQSEVDGLLDLKADLSSFNEHVDDTSNPHSVTKSQVGLGNVDNTSDVNKPVSTATQNALDLKADDVDVVKLAGNQTVSGEKTFTNKLVINNSNYQNHLELVRNNIVAQINPSTGSNSGVSNELRFEGISNVNGYWFDKRISTSEGYYFGNTRKDVNWDAAFTHVSDTSNPHSVTKSQVGLGNVDNTSDVNKPVSTATQNALDLRARKYNVAKGDSNDTDNIMLLAPANSVHNVLGSLWLQRSTGHFGTTKVDILYSTGDNPNNKNAALQVVQGNHNIGDFSIEIFEVDEVEYVGLRRQGTRFFISTAEFIGSTTFNDSLFGTWYETPVSTTALPLNGETNLFGIVKTNGDLTVGGNINVDGTVDGVDVSVLDSSTVKLSGNQNIDGVKRFNSLIRAFGDIDVGEDSGSDSGFIVRADGTFGGVNAHVFASSSGGGGHKPFLFRTSSNNKLLINTGTGTGSSVDVLTSLKTNIINELTEDAGVTIEGVLLKDGVIDGGTF